MSEAVPARLGNYEIVRPIAHGGMGAVYFGRKQGTRGFVKEVAIKTLRLGVDAPVEYQDMFLNEARILSRVAHSSVAQVYDFGEQDGLLYLVMEFVRGVSLGEILSGRDEGLPASEAIALGGPVLRGLHAAHELRDEEGRPLGVVHRDVSPANILVAEDGVPKLIDFGIALSREREVVTQMGQIKGKPGYMAPEQWNGERIDRRADIFALSVVLYESITGRRLFTRDTFAATAMAVCNDEVPRLDRAALGTPPALADVVARGLSKNPARRFATAEEMARALEAIEETEPRVWSMTPGGAAASAGAAIGETVELDAVSSSDGAQPVNISTADESTLESSTPRSRRTLATASVAVFVVLTALAWALTRSEKGEARAGEVKPETSVQTVEAEHFAESEPPKPGPEEPAAAPTAEPSDPRSPAVDAGVSAEESAPAVSRRERREQPRRQRRRRTKTPAPEEPARGVALAPAGVGRLTLIAEPYANVRVDGEDVGVTPRLDLPVPAGEHVIEFLDPRTNRLRHRARVEIRPKQRLRLVAPR